MEQQTENKKLIKKDILYPDLSYQIIGCAFDVYAQIGSGHAEKFYQKALATAFKNRNIIFEEQVYTPLKYRDDIIGKQFLDFLVENKIIVEIKKNNRYSKTHID